MKRFFKKAFIWFYSLFSTVADYVKQYGQETGVIIELVKIVVLKGTVPPKLKEHIDQVYAYVYVIKDFFESNPKFKEVGEQLKKCTGTDKELILNCIGSAIRAYVLNNDGSLNKGLLSEVLRDLATYIISIIIKGRTGETPSTGQTAFAVELTHNIYFS